MRPDEAVAGDGRMYTILIVDDNEELRVLVSNLLAAYFHIEMASGGKRHCNFWPKNRSIWSFPTS